MPLGGDAGKAKRQGKAEQRKGQEVYNIGPFEPTHPGSDMEIGISWDRTDQAMHSSGPSALEQVFEQRGQRQFDVRMTMPKAKYDAGWADRVVAFGVQSHLIKASETLREVDRGERNLSSKIQRIVPEIMAGRQVDWRSSEEPLRDHIFAERLKELADSLPDQGQYGIFDAGENVELVIPLEFFTGGGLVPGDRFGFVLAPGCKIQVPPSSTRQDVEADSNIIVFKYLADGIVQINPEDKPEMTAALRLANELLGRARGDSAMLQQPLHAHADTMGMSEYAGVLVPAFDNLANMFADHVTFDPLSTTDFAANSSIDFRLERSKGKDRTVPFRTLRFHPRPIHFSGHFDCRKRCYGHRCIGL